MIDQPGLRINLDWAMGQLASLEIQSEEWIGAHGFSRFELITDIIVDDLNLEGTDGMAEAMGLTEEQRSAAIKVRQGIKALWKAYGSNARHEVLREIQGWSVIVLHAQLYLASANPRYTDYLNELVEKALIENAKS